MQAADENAIHSVPTRTGKLAPLPEHESYLYGSVDKKRGPGVLLFYFTCNLLPRSSLGSIQSIPVATIQVHTISILQLHTEII